LTTARSKVAVAQTNLAYVYDDLNRLTQATRPLVGDPAETFVYDPVGNRLQRDGQTVNSAFDNANRLMDDTTFTYIYDLNGNLTQKTDKTTGEVTDFTWDVQNQLVKVEKRPSAGAIPTQTIQYKYDAIGRRIQKDVDGTLTIYIYDDADILLEYDGANILQARYTHDQSIDEPILMNRGGVDYFYHTDGLGSITELTDAMGTIVQSYIYDSFGNIQVFDQNGALISPSGGIANPFTYTGRELDTETGLYYYRARYYDSRIGRFISEDRIGFAGDDVNLYGYVFNDPINLIDAFGLRVLNPNNFPIQADVQEALEKFNKIIGDDKDIVITGGDRPEDPGQHGKKKAADIKVPGQSNLETANQAADSGLFGGVGWYEEGYYPGGDVGPHVHVDLRKGTARWGYDKNEKPYKGSFPKYNPPSNEPLTNKPPACL